MAGSGNLAWRDNMTWTNIFTSDFRLPERVCIVAPGPQGKAYYGAIPADHLVIAVSKSVLIPQLRPQVWLMNHVHQPWFDEAIGGFDGIRVFHQDAVKMTSLKTHS